VREEILDILRVDVAAEQQRGAGVPEVVQVGALRQPGALEEILERAHNVAVGRGVPTVEGKTRPWSSQSPALCIRSSSWRLRCAFRAAMLAALRSIRRRLRFVFGAVKFLPASARFNWRPPLPKSTGQEVAEARMSIVHNPHELGGLI
jgi:hypothetical protein